MHYTEVCYRMSSATNFHSEHPLSTSSFLRSCARSVLGIVCVCVWPCVACSVNTEHSSESICAAQYYSCSSAVFMRSGGFSMFLVVLFAHSGEHLSASLYEFSATQKTRPQIHCRSTHTHTHERRTGWKFVRVCWWRVFSFSNFRWFFLLSFAFDSHKLFGVRRRWNENVCARLILPNISLLLVFIYMYTRTRSRCSYPYV